MDKKNRILSRYEMSQKINRLAWQIYENNYSENKIIIAGIDNRGVELSKRISKVLNTISKIKTQNITISLDKNKPLSSLIDISVDLSNIQGNVVILIDDVLNSGRTLSYAVKELLSVDLKKLSTLVLVDRNHNSFPIKADYVGLSLSTTVHDHVNVLFGSSEGVYLS